jgi:chemotaxis signal transduction protein
VSAYLLARVGAERFAFALERVIEALDAPMMHDTPWRPDGLLGTLRHRGQTLPVWDAGNAFGIRRDDALGTALVLDDAGRRVALLVDDAVDIMHSGDDAMRPIPPTGAGEALLVGVLRDAHGLVGVVEMDVLMARLGALGAGREG